MDHVPETYILKTFAILKDGLGPYILQQYKQKFRASYRQEIEKTVRDFNKLAFDSDESLQRSIDTQGWLDLILKNRWLFRDDLDHRGLAHVSELMTDRINLAHEKPLTLDDAYRVADTVVRLLKIINASDKVEQAQNLAIEIQLKLQTQADKTKPRDITPKLGSMPPRPELVIGRNQALRDLKIRLGIISTNGHKPQNSLQVLTAVRGWPGVGKTTIAATIAHDSDLDTAFPNGVLWVSLGEKPDVRAELLKWGRELNVSNVGTESIEALKDKLTAVLHDKKMLLIVDDVWETEHAVPFRVGGSSCATLVTTRFLDVANELTPKAQDVYKLEVLSDEDGLALLEKLAPTVVDQYPQQCRELVHELEGLPLALQVAGRWLNEEANLGPAGLNITEILGNIRGGTELLKKKAPADRADIASQTTPTVAVLLKQSTDRLEETIRICFAVLGDSAVPKPATFSLESLKSLWEVPDPKPAVRALVNRGLLEPAGDRFQMHALLVMHAKSLFEGE